MSQAIQGRPWSLAALGMCYIGGRLLRIAIQLVLLRNEL